MSAADPGPSTADDSGAALPLGSLLADFEVQRVIGEGGFGIVYLARDVHLERLVAVKEYMPTSLATRKANAHVTVRSERHRETFELGRRSFINEAKLLAQLDHPSLVKVLRYWEDRGTAYMAMPYYQGDTLKQRLQQPGAPAPTEAWLRALLMPLLDALEHLHARDLLHRDIAPDNIVLLPNGAPLLLDFGAARHVIGDATQALTVILKPGYAPIEQYAEAASMRQGPWTDLYALAAVMYGAVAGKPPQASVARVLKDELVPAQVLGQGRYTPAWLQWIDSCMAVRPDERPASMAAARALLLVSAGPKAPLVNVTQALESDERTVLMPAAFASAAAAAAQQGAGSALTSPWQGMPLDSDDSTVLRPQAAASATSRSPTATLPAPSAPVAVEPTSRLPPTTVARPPQPRRGWLMGVGAAAMLVLGAGFWWWSAPTATGSSPAPSPAVMVPSAAPAATPTPDPAPQALPTQADPVPTVVPGGPPVGTQATSTANPDEAVPKRVAKPKAKTDAASKVPPKSDAYGDADDEAKPTAANKPAAGECAALLQRASMGDTSPALLARLQAARCR